jgi:hypothetical protein
MEARMDPLTFMLTREARRYETDLRAWAQQVAMARTAEDAIRAAHRKPAPGGLIRGLRHLYLGEEQRRTMAVAARAFGQAGAPDGRRGNRPMRSARGRSRGTPRRSTLGANAQDSILITDTATKIKAFTAMRSAGGEGL